MKQNQKIYIAGHNGMVGSAIRRNLESKGYQESFDPQFNGTGFA